MAGYSKKALHEKLGIKQDMRCCFINAPAGYVEKHLALPKGYAVVLGSPGNNMDFLQWFVENSAQLQRRWPSVQGALAKHGMLWISWPKKSSGITTDINENTIREFGLANGLVDVKVCAVDEIWSGLKFVYRLKDR